MLRIRFISQRDSKEMEYKRLKCFALHANFSPPYTHTKRVGGGRWWDPNCNSRSEQMLRWEILIPKNKRIELGIWKAVTSQWTWIKSSVLESPWPDLDQLCYLGVVSGNSHTCSVLVSVSLSCQLDQVKSTGPRPRNSKHSGYWNPRNDVRSSITQRLVSVWCGGSQRQ